MSANEEWRTVIANTNYEVSNLGRVRNKETGKIKSARTTKTGYKITDLKKNGEKKTAYIHRLVACAFLENPNNLPFINHKDEDKSNNYVSNLEWCTADYNNNYGNHIDNIKKTKRERYGKRIRQIDKRTGDVLREYISITEAAETLGTTHQAILWGLSKSSRTAMGYRWEVVD